jgi:hypothetical protein
MTGSGPPRSEDRTTLRGGSRRKNCSGEAGRERAAGERELPLE